MGRTCYFDGLITNEAFRSKIGFSNSNSEEIDHGNLVDLTNHFPISEKELEDGDNYFYLNEHPCPRVSVHIGVTTVALTKEGRLVFFRQKTNQAIASGMLVASGSGSTDFSDIRNSAESRDFGSIIRYSMARELIEEANFKLLYGIKSMLPWTKRLNVRAIAETTLLTGFFRWVDRCGKPEFIGVTKLNVGEQEIPADNEEVERLRNDMDRCKLSVNDMSGFKILRNRLFDIACDGLTQQGKSSGIALSFLAALERLITISGYKDSTDETERKVFDKVNTFLFGN